MEEDKIEARKICFIQEVYTDGHNTLEEMITYIAGDIRSRNRLRSEINPNLTILKRVWELDENLKRIKED